MGFVAQPPHRPHESRIAADMPLHEMVETGSDQQAYGNNRIQLDGDRKARSFQRPPAQHDKHIHPQNSQCRRHMGASEVDKHMMQVCLIGTERGGPFQYARRHHPQRIEYGNRQYRQRERHQSYVRIHIGSDPRPVLQDRDYKNRHDDAHDKRSAVTDEHFRRFAENIMQKKGNQGADRDCGQDSHRRFAGKKEERAEDQTCHNAIAGRETVDTIYQVDGIDNTHCRNDRQRHCTPIREPADVPQSMKIVYTVTADENQQ